MTRLTDREQGTIELEATGEITHEDYQVILPELERAIGEFGTLDCLIHLHNLKFDVRHATDFGRIAPVTSKGWHRWATKFWAAFIPDAELK